MNFEEAERRDRRNYLRHSIVAAEYARGRHMSKLPGDYQYSHRANEYIARLVAELIELGGDVRNLDARD
jgi:hypothetical protein